MSTTVIKVSKLISYLKATLDNDQRIQQLYTSGEISNLVKHQSGHWYFTLKDDAACVKCVMFSSSVARCNVDVKNGDQVILQGNVSIFESSGQLQLYVTGLKLDGQGNLQLQFEALKKKLFELGFFDENHKKALPRYPEKIGLIAGKNTAAREDVLTTLSRRWPVATIQEKNTLVQGEIAAKEIIEALKSLDESNLDVILLVRGGGSIEDLWAFNDETLARTIFEMKTPVVSGVGHEIDYTIVDFVADYRAPTPTGAAEIATPSLTEERAKINLLQQSLIQIYSNVLKLKRQELNNFINSNSFKKPFQFYQQQVLLVDMKRQQLLQHRQRLMDQRTQITESINRLESMSLKMLHAARMDLNEKEIRLYQLVQDRRQKERFLLMKNIDLLDAYSPTKILKRGYSLAYQEDALISSIHQVKEKEMLHIKLSDGELVTQIIEKRIK